MFSSRAVSVLARQLTKTPTTLLRRSVVGPALATAAAVTHYGPLAGRHNFSTAAAATAPQMFCRQCEQTENHEACTTTQGVCGKTAVTSAAQDALLESVKSLAAWCNAARHQGIDESQLKQANVLTLQAMFSTLTNVNFDPSRITDYLQQVEACKAQLKTLVATPPPEPVAALDWRAHDTVEAVEDLGKKVSVPTRQAAAKSVDAFSLNEIATYGLKGTCAYAAHCYQLGKMDHQVMAEIHELLAALSRADLDVDELLPAVLRVGEINAQVMAMLDQAHAESFGTPEPTQYRTTAVAGKCILISGHDMQDLYALLEQTQGTGIQVYTHGEMLPAHAYPKLKAFEHLAGNYGTAWQNQKVCIVLASIASPEKEKSLLSARLGTAPVPFP